MGEEQKDNPEKEVCIIRVMASVDNDEQAFALKKKLREVFDGMDVQTDFSMSNSRRLAPRS